MAASKLLLITANQWQTKHFEEIGRGGEAVVYKIKDDTVAKIFLQPSDPQFSSDQDLQKAAIERLCLMQTKLWDLPVGLPPHVVTPTGVLVDNKEHVFGYIMPFVKGSKTFSEIQKGAKGKSKNLLLKLYDLIAGLHEKNVVIGDLNENNILVSNRTTVKIVDTDSMQFGTYLCTTFVPRFTPPEFLSIKKGSVSLKEARTTLSDWYGFLVIAMRFMTNTDPYGGVLEGMTLLERMQKHVTVFDSRVIYPKNAVPLRSLARPLLEVFFNAFYNKKRFVPDRAIFEALVEKKTKKKQPEEPRE